MRSARALRDSWDGWLLSCQFRGPFESLDSTGVRKDSARLAGHGVRSQANQCRTATCSCRDLSPVTCYLPSKAKRQGRPPAASPNTECWALFPFVDGFLEFVSRSEFCNAASGNFDRRSGLWVPAIASLALRDGERTESDQGYPVPFLEG